MVGVKNREKRELPSNRKGLIGCVNQGVKKTGLCIKQLPLYLFSVEWHVIRSLSGVIQALLANVKAEVTGRLGVYKYFIGGIEEPHQGISRTMVQCEGVRRFYSIKFSVRGSKKTPKVLWYRPLFWGTISFIIRKFSG